MDLSQKIHSMPFRAYIKAAYAKRRHSVDDTPLEELAERIDAVFGIEAEVIDGELFLFDNRYMILCSRAQRIDLADMSSTTIFCPGLVFMYLLDMTGDTDGRLESDCAFVADRFLAEGTALH